MRPRIEVDNAVLAGLDAFCADQWSTALACGLPGLLPNMDLELRSAGRRIRLQPFTRGWGAYYEVTLSDGVPTWYPAKLGQLEDSARGALCLVLAELGGCREETVLGHYAFGEVRLLRLFDQHVHPAGHRFEVGGRPLREAKHRSWAFEAAMSLDPEIVAAEWRSGWHHAL